MNATLARVNDIARKVFQDDTLNLTEATTAADVDGWDSLMHVTLIVSIEKSFGLRFTSRELVGLKCVGDIVNAITSKKKTA